MKEEKKYSCLDEYLMDICEKYKIEISAIEVGFLNSLLKAYIKDEENKDKGIFIAQTINEKLEKIIAEIYK